MGEIRYASFGQRVGSVLIDWILFSPLMVVSAWAMVQPPAVAVATTVLVVAAYYGYCVVGHAVWGQTVGKWKLGLRVVAPDGERIGWRQALLRSAVDMALAVIATLAFAVVIINMPREALAGVPWDDAMDAYVAARPLWAQLTEWVWYAWLGADTLAMLLNPRRRALHDFVAGTVVINLAPAPATAVDHGRPVWKVVDIGGAIVLSMLSIIFTATAFYGVTDGDTDIYFGSLLIASYAAILAGMLVMARRAARRGGLRASAWWRTAAVVLVAVPLLMIVTGLLLPPA